MMRFRAVKPVRQRRILHPRVIRPRVIRHLILNHFDPLAVRGIHQLAELRQRPKVLLDAIVVDRAVAVIIRDGLAVGSFALVQMVDVVIHRVEPDGRHAQVLQIRQVIDNALEITAVIIARLLPVPHAARYGWIVIGGIAVREAIRHDQVNNVVRREALKAAFARQRTQHFEGCARLASSRNDS
jgi:hypothetical protein